HSKSLRPTGLRRLRRRGRHRRLAAFDHRQLRAADAEGAADLAFDLAGQVGVLLDEELGIFAALTEAHVAVGEPRAGLLDDLVLEADVDQLAGLGDPLAVAYVDLRMTEGCCALVLDDLDLHARADDLLPFLDLIRAADVDAHGRVELERAAAGSRLGVAEHDADLLADLVDENEARPRL